MFKASTNDGYYELGLETMKLIKEANGDVVQRYVEQKKAEE
jgi:hypothetical protein